MKNSNDELLSWNFSEFNSTAKSNSWYVWYGVIAAAFIIYAVITSNFLFAIILILFSLIIFLQNWKKPARVNFSVTPSGIEVGGEFYPMKDIEEFWLAYNPPKVKVIFFNFKTSWRPLLGVPLEDQDPLQVRKILLEYLPENLDRNEEPLPDALARILNL